MIRNHQEPKLHNFVARLKAIDGWKERMANGEILFVNEEQLQNKEKATINYILDYLKREGVYESLKACHI